MVQMDATGPGVVVVVIFGVVATRIAEMRLDQQNRDFLAAVGGVELIEPVMKRYYLWQDAVVVLALAEHFLAGTGLNPWLRIFGLVLLGLSTGLRFWVMSVLGRFWSMRCIFVADAPRVASGPYRFLKHPEYQARTLGVLGLSLFLGSRWAFFVYLIVAAKYIISIIKIEDRQIREMSRGVL